MKRYEKPSIEALAVEVESQLLADSGMGLYDETGDGTTGQLSKRKKEIVVDNGDDDTSLGW